MLLAEVKFRSKSGRKKLIKAGDFKLCYLKHKAVAEQSQNRARKK